MKTLIAYATKHGATREIAERLAKKLGGADLYDLSTPGVPSVADYDCVVVGSGLYASAARPEARAFLETNEAALAGKKLGLFFSGISKGGPDSYLNSNVPAGLVRHAVAAAMLGGKFTPAQSGFFERLVMRIVAKTSAPIDTIDDGAIAAFAEKLSR